MTVRVQLGPLSNIVQIIHLYEKCQSFLSCREDAEATDDGDVGGGGGGQARQGPDTHAAQG